MKYKQLAVVVVGLPLLAIFSIYRTSISSNLYRNYKESICFGRQDIAVSNSSTTELHFSNNNREHRINSFEGSGYGVNKTDQSRVNQPMDATKTPTPDPTELYLKANAEYTWRQCQNLSRKAALSMKYQIVEPFHSRTLTSMKGLPYLFTPIPKCGLTSWTLIFYQSADKMDVLKSENRWAWANNFQNVDLQKMELVEVIESRLKHKHRIIITRNPYDRLVSAYVNKAVEANGLYTKTYQRPCQWLTLKHKKILTFRQFVNCILDRAGSSSQILSSRQAGVALDMHWMPQVHLSLPCLTEYNLIAKYDRFRESSEYLVGLLKLNTTVPTANKSNKSKNQNLTLLYYYKQLKPRELRAMQSLYRYDFEIFGFDSKLPV